MVGSGEKYRLENDAARDAMKGRTANTMQYLEAVTGAPGKPPGINDAYRD